MSSSEGSSNQVRGGTQQVRPQYHQSSPQCIQPVMVAPTPPGALAFYPQNQGTVIVTPQGQGLPCGGVVVTPQVMLGAPVLYYQSPRFEYKPNDFVITTILTIIVCGLFSPFFLIFSLPALYYAVQSSKSAKANSIKLARFQGMVAAYLNAAAVVFSLVIAFVVSPVVIAIITPNDLDRCISIVKDRYHGEIPTRTYSNFNGTYIYYDFSC